MKFRLKPGVYLMRDAYDLEQGNENVWAVWSYAGGSEDDMLVIAWDGDPIDPPHPYSHQEGFGRADDEVELPIEGVVPRFAVIPLTDLQLDILTMSARHGTFHRVAAKLWERTHAPA